ncbi:MAG: response regulator transcription factor, partial [Anaerolineales bacterium]
ASILMVDDQPLTLATVIAALSLDGYQIFTAKDGIEALEVLEHIHIDLIIADIAMPRMNGYQLFDAVQQDSRWVHLPYIFLTARSLDSDIRYGKELGIDDYLTKPFQLEDLRASISGKLRRYKQNIPPYSASAHNRMRQDEDLVDGQLCIYPNQHRLTIGEVDVALSVKEFSLLLYLARHKGQVIPLVALCQATHGLTTDKVEAGSLLYPIIRSLRSKLAPHTAGSERIQNVRGVGYLWV